MMLLNYVSKKQLKGAVGERLSYIETSLFGDEYKSTGSFMGARRPHLQGGGREFFAKVTMKDDKIVKVV
tara:strand:+ start:463 stop:669 length:207 start_codon:yes stop_codon:yes gene_type:complete